MENQKDWIKIHRNLINWDWYDDPSTFKLFIHCLLKANHKERKYRGVNVEIGSFITSREILSLETGLTISQVRTSLDKLKITNEITIKSNRQGTVIQIVNYIKYQHTDDNVANEMTSKLPLKSPTSSQRVASNKNDNNVNNVKNEKNATRSIGESEVDNLEIEDTLFEELFELYPKKSTRSKSFEIFNKCEHHVKYSIINSVTELKNIFNLRFPIETEKEKYVRFIPNLVKYIQDKIYIDDQSFVCPLPDFKKEDKNGTNTNYQSMDKTKSIKEMINQFKN